MIKTKLGTCKECEYGKGGEDDCIYGHKHEDKDCLKEQKVFNSKEEFNHKSEIRKLTAEYKLYTKECDIIKDALMHRKIIFNKLFHDEQHKGIFKGYEKDLLKIHKMICVIIQRRKRAQKIKTH